MNTPTKNQDTILVIGGNGKTGSRVVQRLKEAGINVKSASRSGEITFDWENDATWKAALQGITKIYITFQPDLAAPGAVEKITLLSEMAQAAGVKKLVLLSGRGEPEAQDCEHVVMQSGLDWTIVRASWFSQNFSEGYLLEPILAGEVVLPAGDVGEPFVDTDDIADVAFAALTQNGHDGQVYEVTGPRLLTFREALAEIAAASGREIVFQYIPVSDYAEALRSYDLPDSYVNLIVYLFSEILDGRNSSLSDGVEKALGRKPKDFAAFAKETAAAGIWNR